MVRPKGLVIIDLYTKSHSFSHFNKNIRDLF